MGFEINLCGSFVSRLTAGFRIFISLARWGCKATQMCWMAGYVTLLVQVDQRLELAHRKTLDKYDILKKKRNWVILGSLTWCVYNLAPAQDR